jgi:hypothetical protein
MIILKLQGGLGNQLFQYATGRALSIELNTILKLDLSFYNNNEFSKVYRLNEFNLPFEIANKQEIDQIRNQDHVPLIFRILNKTGVKVSPYFKRSHLIEKEILKLYNPDIKKGIDYYIDGWLGDEAYFKMHEKQIRKDLRSDDLLNNESKIVLDKIVNSNSVAIHIRRGDYLTNSFFANLSQEYYSRSISFISKEISHPAFFFFSDDIKWVKENISVNEKHIFVEHNSAAATKWNTIGEINDLLLMSYCNHQIIANSTFSWWGAWLNSNPDKVVIAPRKWFDNAKAQSDYERGHFIPIKWIKI